MAQNRVYGKWAGNPKGIPEDTSHCIKAIFGGDFTSRQCQKKRKYGPEGEYCKQHAKEFDPPKEKTWSFPLIIGEVCVKSLDWGEAYDLANKEAKKLYPEYADRIHLGISREVKEKKNVGNYIPSIGG